MDWDSGAGQAAGRAPMVTATAQEEWRNSGVGCGGGEEYRKESKLWGKKVESYSWKTLALFLWRIC